MKASEIIAKTAKRPGLVWMRHKTMTDGDGDPVVVYIRETPAMVGAHEDAGYILLSADPQPVSTPPEAIAERGKPGRKPKIETA